MIFVRLAGGLGNQLYQLAAASLLSNSSYIPLQVVPLIDGLSSYKTPREPDSLLLLQPNDWLLNPNTAIPTPWRALTLNARAGRWLPYLGISDRNFWQTLKLHRRSTMMLDGYFQHGWTQEMFARAISLLPVRGISEAAAARISSEEVLMHVRGGDFLRLTRFKVVDANFYVRAARHAFDRGLRNFAIISDDPAYAEFIRNQICDEISLANIRMIPHGMSSLEDFDTIRAATSRIIGNSTFAWWASAFGNAPAPTWSPKKFTIDSERDFYLSYEIPLS